MIDDLFDRKAYEANAHSIRAIVGYRKLVVYGAGNYYQFFQANVLDPAKMFPDMIIDRKYGEPINGLVGPDHYHPSAEYSREAIVIITVSDQSERHGIFSYLYELGFDHIVGAEEVYDVNITPNSKAWGKGFDFYESHRAEIESAYALMADDESREVFRAVAKTHIQRSPQKVPCHPVVEQYYPADLGMRDTSRLIVCGAYDGDTIPDDCEELACFEPDPDNFRALVANGFPGILFPCAVGDGERMVPFQAGIGKSSRIVEDSDKTVQCVAIDHVLPHFCTTRINMDIEGAEPEALRGCLATLRGCQPDLAICVYHEPEHLWEIPLWLDMLKLGYKFYLRNYTGAVVETVLYATTGES